MSSISTSAAVAFLSLFLAAPALPAQTIAAAPSPGMSKVRIVRVSEIRGAVQVDRGVGRGFEPAIDNLPIVEDSRVRTDIGIAEIEFEDNSTLRLGPNSEVDFSQLERAASGATITHVRVVQGLAYVSLMNTRGNDFALVFGPANNPEVLKLAPSSHIRLQVAADGAQIAVLDGTLQVNGADGLVTVPHKRTVSINFAQMNQPTVSKRVAEDSFDAWDRQSAEYHERAASLSAFGNTPYSYGLNDMMYYGAFEDAGGCGMMWRPYFASAAWNPYANGVWAWYGDAGYSWVSPYPWGWMPYHSGSWSYCPGNGWGWMPGSGWNGLSNAPAVTKKIAGANSTLPQPPSHPPTKGGPTLMLVSQRPLVASQMGKGSFVFRRDSAGLGIPREELGNLRGFSRDTLRHGTASTPVYLAPEVNNDRMGGPSRRMAGQFAPLTMHRGFAPAPGMSPETGFRPPEDGGGFSPRPGTSMSNSTGSSRPAAGGGASHGTGGATGSHQ